MIRASTRDFAVAAALCGTVALAFVMADHNVRHWFVVPVFVCGVLIGGDGIAWMRGRMNLFDPMGILGVLGLHFFFVAPLLHVHWDYWMNYVQPLPDWRAWLGYMAILNMTGLLCYRFCAGAVRLKGFAQRWSSPRVLHHRRLVTVLAILLPLTLVLQIVVFAYFGGVSGYIDAFSDRDGAFRGLGWLFVFSESFPMLAAMGYVHWVRRQPVPPRWTTLACLFVGFFMLQLLFGGLRGSRSETIWKLFWVAGMLHLAVRPLPKKVVVAGALFVIMFMYVYGFYKGAGRDTVGLLKEGLVSAEEQTGRTLSVVLLGDFGRSDVQAYLLHNSIVNASENRFAYGRTYLGAACIPIPRIWWPDRPPTKVKEGTDALYGPGAWNSGAVSRRVYGLAGEAILNCGFLSVPLAYSLLGGAVGITRRYIYSLRQVDGRVLIAPFLVQLCVTLMTGDSDNLAFAAIKNGLLPIGLVLFCLTTRSSGVRRVHGLG